MLATAASVSAATPKLDFIHIPKTGGQAIESWGYLHGFSWGGCRLPGGGAWPEGPHPFKCSAFHIPPAVWEAAGTPAYDGADTTFCVVRHPYTRAISEYLWQGYWKPQLWGLWEGVGYLEAKWGARFHGYLSVCVRARVPAL